MQCYTELTPPTAVTASVALPFLSSSANNLIVAKTSLLQVFALKSVVSEAAETRKNSFTNTDTSPKVQRRERTFISKLILISEYDVSGTITALARVKAQRSKSGGEFLLVAIKDAKLSLVEWDPEKHSISTVSIHYYERDDLQSPPWAPVVSKCDSILTVDPSSRCAALKFGVRSLTILPLGLLGDDLVIEDEDHDTSTQSKRRQSSMKVNGDNSTVALPYSASFVLSLVQLDPTLIHPIHLAFLHEYREPTVGILSSKIASSAALLHERRDPICYTVYTLDLEQQASTPLVSIPGLPYDIHRIVPLPLPVGGALLIGNNELIHVDQAGKINSVAVNSLATAGSSFPLVFQGELDLRLEGCVIEQLGSANGELLLITNTGELSIVSFRLDGRSVSGFSIHTIPDINGGDLLKASASCASHVGGGRIFVGSQDGDSVLLGWSSKGLRQRQLRRDSEAAGVVEDSLDEDFDEDGAFEDDLYADEKPNGHARTLATPVTELLDDLAFRVHDTLPNLGPLIDITLMKSKLFDPLEEDRKDWAKLDLVAASGRGQTSSLVRLSPEISPSVTKRFDIAGVTRLWAVHAESASGEYFTEDDVHNFLITSMDPEFSEGGSQVFRLDEEELELMEGYDFEPEAGATVEVGSLLNGVRIVQVLKNEVRAFDGDFGLAQIIPSIDDASIVAASFADPFVLLVKDDGRIALLRADDSGDLEELTINENLASQTWKSGSLYDDVNDTFRLTQAQVEDESSSSVLLFLLNSVGGLQIFCLPHFYAPVYEAAGLSFLPPYLTTEFTVRRSHARDSLEEILVAQLGDKSSNTPFLILRSNNNDIILYSPYHDTRKRGQGAALQFRKIDSHRIPKAPPNDTSISDLQAERSALRVLPDFGGYHAVFVPGISPCLIFKSASSNPKIIDLRTDQLASLTRIRTTKHRDAILYPGTFGRLTLASIPLMADFTTGWAIEKLHTMNTIRAFTYHEQSDRYVVGTSQKVDFRLPKDGFHPEWESEAVDSPPCMDQDELKVVDPNTWTVTETRSLEPNEVIMCMKKMSLEISENTHNRNNVIGVGTGIIRGEDINTQGTIYVFDVIDVVPEPGRPESGRKLKKLAQHKDKGAVTAVSQVGTEGFLLAAHGQKCMVRGIKEDNSLLPVAFVDTQCYISVAKELQGTGLCMLGDAVKGLWLAGYTEDPYHLKMLGKSAHDVEVLAADFLPDGKNLSIVLADSETNLHILRFDPHNPKSLSGQHLLNLSSFHTGSHISTMTLLPRVQTSWERLLARQAADDMDVDGQDQGQAENQILVTSQTGAISLITPLPEASTTATDAYRSLAALQTYLSSALPHPLGLSPKAYRNVNVDMSIGGRAMLDGNVLRRWMELGSWKRAEGVSRIGSEGDWEVKALLEGICGRGLGFL